MFFLRHKAESEYSKMASISMFGKGTVVEVSQNEYNEVPSDLSTVSDLVDFSCVATSVQHSGISADNIDTSTLCSQAKEYEAGDIDPGELTFDAHFVPNECAMYQALQAATYDRKKRLWVVTFGNGSKFACVGYVSNRPWSVPSMSEIVTQTITVKCSGLPVEILAACANL